MLLQQVHEESLRQPEPVHRTLRDALAGLHERRRACDEALELSANRARWHRLRGLAALQAFPIDWTHHALCAALEDHDPEIRAAAAGVLANGDKFGSAATALGDLDGDGVSDLAVGAFRDDTGGNGRGAGRTWSGAAAGSGTSAVLDAAPTESVAQSFVVQAQAVVANATRLTPRTGLRRGLLRESANS